MCLVHRELLKILIFTDNGLQFLFMATNGPIRILVDHRESNTALWKALYNHPQFDPQSTCLSTGDFQIGEMLLIERKTWSDFAISIIQGRLFRQAMRLNKSVRDRVVDTAAFIIEGAEQNMIQLNMSREAILGAITSLEIRFQLPVFRTMNPAETVTQIGILYRQMQEAPVRGTRTFPPRYGKFSRKSKRGQQVFILQGLPGIGASRAGELLDTFGSLKKIFQASEMELLKVSGIGKDTAKRIRKILNS